MPMENVSSFEVPSWIGLHHVNGYELVVDDEKYLVLDSVMKELNSFKGIGETAGFEVRYKRQGGNYLYPLGLGCYF